MITEKEIKIKLKKLLNRTPKKSEVLNAFTDQNIVNEILQDTLKSQQDEIIKLKSRLTALESVKNVV